MDIEIGKTFVLFNENWTAVEGRSCFGCDIPTQTDYFLFLCTRMKCLRRERHDGKSVIYKKEKK